MKEEPSLREKLRSDRDKQIEEEIILEANIESQRLAEEEIKVKTLIEERDRIIANLDAATPSINADAVEVAKKEE